MALTLGAWRALYTFDSRVPQLSALYALQFCSAVSHTVSDTYERKPCLFLMSSYPRMLLDTADLVWLFMLRQSHARCAGTMVLRWPTAAGRARHDSNVHTMGGNMVSLSPMDFT